MLTAGKRAALLDKVAEMVDENLSGRSEMCLQFAELLNLALRHLGFNSFAVLGTATYLNAKEKRVFQWRTRSGCESERNLWTGIRTA